MNMNNVKPFQRDPRLGREKTHIPRFFLGFASFRLASHSRSTSSSASPAARIPSRTPRTAGPHDLVTFARFPVQRQPSEDRLGNSSLVGSIGKINGGIAQGGEHPNFRVNQLSYFGRWLLLLGTTTPRFRCTQKAKALTFPAQDC